jgi:hypothetical protein
LQTLAAAETAKDDAAAKAAEEHAEAARAKDDAARSDTDMQIRLNHSLRSTTVLNFVARLSVPMRSAASARSSPMTREREAAKID